MKGEDDVKLEEEYKLLKKSTSMKKSKTKSGVSTEKQRKRKRENSTPVKDKSR